MGTIGDEFEEELFEDVDGELGIMFPNADQEELEEVLMDYAERIAQSW